MRNNRSQVVGVVAAVTLAGCELIAPPGGVGLTGAVYTDVHVDAPCEGQQGPEELSQVVLTFSDPSGSVLGTATTGPLSVEEMPHGPGTEGWAHGGCRFLAAYAVRLPVADAYAVEFDPPDPPANPNAGYFDGANQLEPATTTYAELAADGFTWSFEAPPAYVVP